MRWKGRRQSANVEDRRGQSPRGRGRGMTMGCGGLVLVIVFALLTGQDPTQLLDVIGGVGGGGQAPSSPGPATSGSPGDQLGQFASVVLADTEDTWNQLFPQMGGRYTEPRLVLFSGAVQSACGFNSAAVGPFYCPGDRKLYIDLSFFNELDRRMGAKGDFAQAYVIAHEVGHHVQKLLGISDQVRQAQSRMSRTEANGLSVRMELQADCFAGVWGNHAHNQRNLLEPGDIEEGLTAAAAIGDDKLQRQSTGYTRPETWTHGSSEMRQRWLTKGLQTGDPSACDTFQADRL
ncbi:MAG: zinc metallopeptidase [Deltaproteobacteria bacterium]|nr:zinc metallopeptidase [Deltaproteobacteria bacterium]